MLFPRYTAVETKGASGYIIEKLTRNRNVTTKDVTGSRPQTPYMREHGTMTQKGFVPGVTGPLPYSVYNTYAWNLRNDAIGVAANDLALQRAWLSFARNVSDHKAQIGTSLAEWRESADMLSNRATQLLRFGNSIRKGQFGKARSALRIRKDAPRVRSGHSLSKDLSAAWLEYWLGIAPLLGDIESAVNILQGDPPGGFVVGTGTAEATWDVTTTDSYEKLWRYAKGTVSWRYGAYLRIENPNLALAQELGLVNLASIGFELIPLSFILNWLIPIGQWLDSYSCLCGLVVVSPNRELRWRVNGVERSTDLQGRWPVRSNETVYKLNARGLNISMPPIVIFDVPTQLSVTRAATAVSLLITQLKG